jgi:hypothetical protein
MVVRGRTPKITRMKEKSRVTNKWTFFYSFSKLLYQNYITDAVGNFVPSNNISDLLRGHRVTAKPNFFHKFHKYHEFLFAVVLEYLFRHV